MLRNFRMVLQYDGTNFDGWQKQGNTGNTIQGRLESALSGLFGQPVEVHGSGRTDAGVHARGQTANFKADTDLDCETLLHLLRSRFPEAVGLLRLEETDLRFHSRLQASSKTYVYRLRVDDTPAVFDRRFCWQQPGPLDLSAMRRAAGQLCGRHDFRSFCANRQMKKSTVRTLASVNIVPADDGHELRFEFTGDGFLYHMVRILTGTLIEVGQGRRPADSMEEVLQARSRQAAGFTAPACGLTLWEVSYT